MRPEKKKKNPVGIKYKPVQDRRFFDGYRWYFNDRACLPLEISPYLILHWLWSLLRLKVIA